MQTGIIKVAPKYFGGGGGIDYADPKMGSCSKHPGAPCRLFSFSILSLKRKKVLSAILKNENATKMVAPKCFGGGGGIDYADPKMGSCSKHPGAPCRLFSFSILSLKRKRF